MAPPRAPKSEYISTDTGNKISRRAQIHGTQNIILGGRCVIQASTVLRGDLVRLPSAPLSVPAAATAAPPGKQGVAISLGRYTLIAPGCVLRPPFLPSSGSTPNYTPLRIESHTYVGPGCVIEASSIGSHVHIGAGCVVGKFVVVKDRVKILAGTVVPGGMVVPSGCVVGGRPGRVLGEVGEGWGVGGEEEGGEGREGWRGVG